MTREPRPAGRNALERCGPWLTALDVTGLGAEAEALRALGLLLIGNGGAVIAAFDAQRRGRLRMPPMETLVAIGRRPLIRLTTRMLSARHLTFPEGSTADNAALLGGLALVFARSGDLTVVAGLLRAAATHGLHGPALDAGLDFLLSQQATTGAFGLLSEGLADDRLRPDALGAQLRATVEVLWAAVSHEPRLAG